MSRSALPIIAKVQAAFEAIAMIPELAQVKRAWVGYSGGLDSTVLLAATNAWAKANNIAVTAVHIHHGLQPAADDFATHCQRTAAALAIQCVVHPVQVADGGEGPEASARNARYQAFAELLGDAELLMLGHHRQDQIETLLLRLLRGASVRNLAGMPDYRRVGTGYLWRPLLKLPRSVLLEYAQAKNLDWIEDPTNASLDLERGRLRELLLPVLEAHWPDHEQKIYQLAERAQEAVVILDETAQNDLAHLATAADCAAWQNDSASPQVIQHSGLKQLSAPRRLNLLRTWFSAGQIWNLAEPQWRELDRQVMTAEPCHFTCTQARLMSFQDKLWLLRGQPLAPKPCEHLWQPDQVPSLATAEGELIAEPALGQGLRATSEPLLVRCWRSDDRILFHGMHRSLQKVFRTLNVPAWTRPLLPLIFVGDKLVAIADLYVAPTARAGAGVTSWQLRWQPNNDYARCIR